MGSVSINGPCAEGRVLTFVESSTLLLNFVLSCDSSSLIACRDIVGRHRMVSHGIDSARGHATDAHNNGP